MIRKVLLPTIFGLLAYGFWISPDFQEIAAGVSIFLFGMLTLEQGFRSFTGGVLEVFLRKTTGNLWKSIGFGFFSTSLMQSSSLVSVISISFLSAGFIPLAAGVGIIYGANLGTTTGAWLVAGFGLKVNISAYAMPMLVFGIILVFQKSKRLKGCGYVLGGLGFLFLGIHHMKEGFATFKDTIDLAAFSVEGYPGLLLFSLIGLVATVVIQSSHATLVLIIAALSVEQITYENGLALAIGANIGTTVTAIIGSLGANVEGRRLAGAHLIFNVITALVAIVFIHQLKLVVDQVSLWMDVPPDNYTLKLAVFHSVFNGLGIVLMLPFVKTMVGFLQRTMKPRERNALQPRYLYAAAIDLSDTAIEAAKLETIHLYEHASRIIANGIGLRMEDVYCDEPLEELIARSAQRIEFDVDGDYDASLKSLYGEVVRFIGDAQANLSFQQSEELFSLRATGRDILESVKDTKHLQKNLIHYLGSPDPVMRREYDRIRLSLAGVLRRINEVRELGGDSVAILSLDTLKLALKEHDQELDAHIDRLIREDEISALMSVSLIKDIGYSYGITKKLVGVAEALFSTSDLRTREAERMMALDESDVDEVIRERKTERGEESYESQ